MSWTHYDTFRQAAHEWHDDRGPAADAAAILRWFVRVDQCEEVDIDTDAPLPRSIGDRP